MEEETGRGGETEMVCSMQFKSCVCVCVCVRGVQCTMIVSTEYAGVREG
jgi:hypothetical protein